MKERKAYLEPTLEVEFFAAKDVLRASETTIKDPYNLFDTSNSGIDCLE